MSDVLLATIRTHEDVYDLMEQCDNSINEGITTFPNKTYEEGIATVLSWLLDESDIIAPLEE